MLGAEAEVQYLIGIGDRFHRELGNQPILVFQFYVEIVGSENRRGSPDDVGEFPRGEAVIDIISHPSLEAQVGDLADSGATIEEGLINAADFRDVSMHGNHSSIWKKILKLMVGELTEGGDEFGGFHVKWVIGDG